MFRPRTILSRRVRPTNLRSAFLWFVIAGGLSGPLARADSHYQGTAFDRSGAVLYTETHWVRRDAQGTRHLVLYRCADGTPFARKLITATPDNETAPDYRFVDARRNYSESVERDGNALVIVTQRDDLARTHRVRWRSDGLVDAGFDYFVQTSLASLATGTVARRPFLLANEGRYIDVRIEDARNVRWQGMDAMSLGMRLDAWYGIAAPKIRLFYAREDAALLEYDGIGTIRRDDGGALQVRIVFPPQRRRNNMRPGAMQSAEVLPLSSRCSLR